MFQFTRENTDPEVIYFTYNTIVGGTIKLGLAYVSEAINNELVKTVREAKGKKKSDLNYWDNLAYRRALVRKSLKDIKGATYLDLQSLVEPGNNVIVPPECKWTDVVSFDPNVKEFIAMGMTGNVADFIEAACREVETFLQKKYAEEMRNLDAGSNTNPATA